MSVELDPAQAIDIWRNAVCEGVRDDKPDLTARQMAVLLIVYRDQDAPTVRGLAKELNLQKPAVTRALDRLAILGMIRRKVDQSDRRNVLIQRTVVGSVFLSEFAELVVRAGQDSTTPPLERPAPALERPAPAEPPAPEGPKMPERSTMHVLTANDIRGLSGADNAGADTDVDEDDVWNELASGGTPGADNDGDDKPES